MASIHDVAEQFLAGWSKDDPETLLAMCAETLVYEDVPVGAVLHNKDELRGLHTMFRTAMPDLSFTLDSASGDQGTVTVEWTVTGTHTGTVDGLPPATGKPAQVRGVSVINLDDTGRMTACRDYWDPATWLRQIGQLE